nr:hypothetical protein Iba_chr04bCG19360 [Ipomoea batatas]
MAGNQRKKIARAWRDRRRGKPAVRKLKSHTVVRRGRSHNDPPDPSGLTGTGEDRRPNRLTSSFTGTFPEDMRELRQADFDALLLLIGKKSLRPTLVGFWNPSFRSHRRTAEKALVFDYLASELKRASSQNNCGITDSQSITLPLNDRWITCGRLYAVTCMDEGATKTTFPRAARRAAVTWTREKERIYGGRLTKVDWNG